MVNARIKNTVVTAKIQTTVPNARGYRATTSSTTSGGAGIVVGNPIGLLLALTYATAGAGSVITTNTSDMKPNTRIITN